MGDPAPPAFPSPGSQVQKGFWELYAGLYGREGRRKGARRGYRATTSGVKKKNPGESAALDWVIAGAADGQKAGEKGARADPVPGGESSHLVACRRVIRRRKRRQGRPRSVRTCAHERTG